MVDKTIAAVADHGLENVALRSIAASAGVSTAAIVHHFTNKDGLFRSAAYRALEIDREFNRRFIKKFVDLRLDWMSFVELVSFYLLQRANDNVAVFWMEVLFKSRDLPGYADLINRWYDDRSELWAYLIKKSGADPGLAGPFGGYMIMEEVFFHGLGGFDEYPLLRRESLRSWTVRSFGSDVAATHGSVSEWLNRMPTSFGIAPVEDPESLRHRLLERAADEILAGGISALNQRAVTRHLKVSSSMVVYHFGDMATFVRGAIWRALLRNVPGEIDGNDTSLVREDTIGDWSSTLAGMIRPSSLSSDAGYYVAFARITGQASLLSRRQPALFSLVRHIRIIEGFGTYLASRSIWPEATSFDRAGAAAFGIWIKGQALLNEALGRKQTDDERAQVLLSAARLVDGVRDEARTRRKGRPSASRHGSRLPPERPAG